MMETMSISKTAATFFVGATLALGLAGGIGSPAFANTTSPSSTQERTQAKDDRGSKDLNNKKKLDQVSKVQKNIKKVDDSNLAFRLSDGDRLADDGSALISSDGTKQELPSEATDKNGNAVNLKYAEEDGVVTINVIDAAASTNSGRQTPGEPVTDELDDNAKCALGTGGGAGTGAIAGGAAGATIGSAFPGVGTVAGWTIGTAIGGAVSGGAVGAATFC